MKEIKIERVDDLWDCILCKKCNQDHYMYQTHLEILPSLFGGTLTAYSCRKCGNVLLIVRDGPLHRAEISEDAEYASGRSLI